MRKSVTLLLAFTVILATVLGMTLTVSAESLYIRKIVSVVYDDSTSMEGDKWAYANYAMQAFCGMLNSEDQLYITYMSRASKEEDYSPEQVDLSADGIQKSVNTIRDHSSSYKTPYKAVEIAHNKLNEVSDQNPNTEYWLVVITDGDFDEVRNMKAEEKKRFVNEHFESYTDKAMPNGSKLQITFLAIGDSVVSPDEDKERGIHTYKAQNADEITDAMSKMADKVSGRSRLEKNEIKKVNENTIQVSSSIPLLNIAVFAQGAQAEITGALQGSEHDVTISRKATLEYPGYSDLIGAAYLLGDSQQAMGDGKYDITFKQPVNPEDIVILFEPALEARMTLSVNGEEIKDYRELDEVSAGDKLSVSCKIYEMGTDNEINPDLLPPNTKYEITISENGKEVKKSTDEEMELTDYKLNDVETEVKAAVTIEGFNPIDYSEKFTPTKFIKYTVEASYGSDTHSVKFDDIASNKDLTLQFTVLADGEAITDTEAVKKLKPEITVLPAGNEGEITYSDDGKIIFTPNTASMTSSTKDNFKVEVTCKIENGESVTAEYTVLLADYSVVANGTNETIRKTEFFDNKIGTSFYITKDGVKLTKADLEDKLSAKPDEKYSHLKTKIEVSDDGTITVIPYSEEEHKITFLNWWTNWYYYFTLEGDDITVTLNHPVGNAESTIGVVGATVPYILLNVILPLVIELTVLVFLITWIVLIIIKPKYPKNSKLYVADIKYNTENYSHTIRRLKTECLDEYNKLKYRWKFKKTAEIISVYGIDISAARNGKITCHEGLPCYKGRIIPTDDQDVTIENPSQLADYFSNPTHKRLEIVEIVPNETIDSDNERLLSPARQKNAKYIIVPDPGKTGTDIIEDRRVIKKGKIFIYTD